MLMAGGVHRDLTLKLALKILIYKSDFCIVVIIVVLDFDFLANNAF